MVMLIDADMLTATGSYSIHFLFGILIQALYRCVTDIDAWTEIRMYSDPPLVSLQTQ